MQKFCLLATAAPLIHKYLLEQPFVANNNLLLRLPSCNQRLAHKPFHRESFYVTGTPSGRLHSFPSGLFLFFLVVTKGSTTRKRNLMEINGKEKEIFKVEPKDRKSNQRYFPSDWISSFVFLLILLSLGVSIRLATRLCLRRWRGRQADTKNLTSSSKFSGSCVTALSLAISSYRILKVGENPKGKKEIWESREMS